MKHHPAFSLDVYRGTRLVDSLTPNEVINANISPRVTESVGTFTINMKNHDQDVTYFDKIKFRIGWDTVPASACFAGKVEKIDTHYNSKLGDIISLQGKCLTEVLLRRLWTGHYTGTTTHDIADEICAELGIGTAHTEAESATPDFEFIDQMAFDVMKNLSDCWISAGTQLKKDFRIDEDNDMIYADRPFRSASLTPPSPLSQLRWKKEILDYSVRRTIEDVKNNITVFGDWDEDSTQDIPSDENWTEPDNNNTPPDPWYCTQGSLFRDDVDEDVGTYCLRIDPIENPPAGGNWYGYFGRYLRPDFAFITGNKKTTNRSFQYLHFHCKTSIAIGVRVYLLAPTYANSYYRDEGGSFGVAWASVTRQLPETGDAHGWSSAGSPLPQFITGVRWDMSSIADFLAYVDGLAFRGGRFSFKVSDATSIAAYGQRDLVIVDDTLIDVNMVESKAKTLLYQRKDPTVEVDITAKGDVNILNGDQFHLQLGSGRHGIHGDFNAQEVNHVLSATDFTTRFTAIEGLSIRKPVPKSLGAELGSLRVALREIGRDAKTIR